MHRVDWRGICGVLALAAIVWLAASAPAPAATNYVECQHPVVTGVEVSHLRDVSASTACPVALALFRWENKDDHIRELYVCKGKSPGKPVLRRHSFEGWALSIARSGFFEMSRGRSSFAVSGTDFPVICD